MLAGLPAAGAPLAAFLPPATEPRAASALQRRAALASTLLAGLELARDGEARLRQPEPFGPIAVAPAAAREAA